MYVKGFWFRNIACKALLGAALVCCCLLDSYSAGPLEHKGWLLIVPEAETLRLGLMCHVDLPGKPSSCFRCWRATAAFFVSRQHRALKDGLLIGDSAHASIVSC